MWTETGKEKKNKTKNKLMQNTSHLIHEKLYHGLVYNCQHSNMTQGFLGKSVTFQSSLKHNSQNRLEIKYNKSNTERHKHLRTKHGLYVEEMQYL